MSNVTIRKIEREEMINITQLFTGYAFRTTPPLQPREEWEKEISYHVDATIYAAFENDKPVANAAVTPMTHNVRGKLYQGGGIWAVSTLPTARRKGYARNVISHIFHQLHDEGIPFTSLYVFKESFYTRLGYTTFPQYYTASFPAAALQPLLKKELKGEVELVNIAEGFDIYYDYLQQRLPHIHGMGLFSPENLHWMRDKQSYWLAIARVDGEVKGIALYRLKHNNRNNMQVTHFFYSDSQGKYLLLEWFGRHVDHIQDIELRLRPDERIETWWPDLNVRLESQGAPLGRVLDVMNISGMQVGEGSFTASIKDHLCPWNEGSYQFSTVDGRLQVQVQPTTFADCELTIQGLSALVYGTHDPETFAIREWGNPSEQIQATMRSMFPAQLPYLHETF